MPRIITSASDPVDFCKRCFPEELEAIKRYADVGHGPDDRGNCFEYEAVHPDYTADDQCIRCKKFLTGVDD